MSRRLLLIALSASAEPRRELLRKGVAVGSWQVGLGGNPGLDARQALELTDTVLQGLVVAKMALDLDQPVKANEALTASIASASRIITELLGSQHHSLDLLRSVPTAVVAPTPTPDDLSAPMVDPKGTPDERSRAPHPTGARRDHR